VDTLPDDFIESITFVRSRRDQAKRKVDDLDDVLARLIDDARAKGYSWSDIAGPLGISRQAVTRWYQDRRRVSTDG
jgi:DNA invertase Pin-like site-specific DNA recombinase